MNFFDLGTSYAPWSGHYNCTSTELCFGQPFTGSEQVNTSWFTCILRESLSPRCPLVVMEVCDPDLSIPTGRCLESFHHHPAVRASLWLGERSHGLPDSSSR